MFPKLNGNRVKNRHVNIKVAMTLRTSLKQVINYSRPCAIISHTARTMRAAIDFQSYRMLDAMFTIGVPIETMDCVRHELTALMITGEGRWILLFNSP